MDSVAEIKKTIADLEKHTSLRQIAIQSGVNYITLRNIKFGKSSSVTERVANAIKKFAKTFDPAKAEKGGKRRGRPPGSRNKKSAKKPGPKPQKAKSTAAKKSTPKKTTGKKRGPGRPKKAAPAPAAPAVKAAAASDDFLFGNDLKKEIARTEARLDYLKSLEKAQNEYVKAMQ